MYGKGSPRKPRIDDVVKRLVRGPQLSDPKMFGQPPLTPDDVTKHYRMWAETWILLDLADLYPEIRQALKEQGIDLS